MSIKVYANVAGFFVYDSNDMLKTFIAYPKEAEEIAARVHNLSIYTISEELEMILKEIDEEIIETNSADVVNYARSKGKKSELNVNSEFYQKFLTNLFHNLIQQDYISDEKEYQGLVREVGISLSKKRVAHSSQRVDKNVVHAILSMDDIDKTTNLFSARISEWYGVHFPEIMREVQNHLTLCKIITTIGTKDNFTEENVKSFGFSNEKSKRIVNLARKSMGADFTENDLRPLQDLSLRIIDLYEEREKLEVWIGREISRIAPNMKAIVGAPIAARLIALAGGLRELAMKPASTIQLLGAEKALFRALKTGAKPPKHGIIYQIPVLHGCPWWQKGNISRAIAGRLTIAGRVDFFQGEFIGDQLKLEVDRKVEEIKEKYKEAPEGKKPPIDRSFQPRHKGPQIKPQYRKQGKGKKPYYPKKKGGKSSYPRRR
ncbi:MAG: C/D box methylation guide ribonucleoprotein complex aNOP56 subunit [Candidatus Heimdallarchaeota archaeon]|nr:C/D box methylation guide ribonucleoprotein complex aNOP56 subunit [Candidatus Heimdallarchaeota archaeon]